MSKDYPVDARGEPMAVITGSIEDLIPTVAYGNVKIAASITRPVPNGTDEELVNATRQVLRDVEFVVGCERRLVQHAIDPSIKLASPVPADQQFAAPPPGYDPASMPPHPGDQSSVDPAPKS